MSNKQPGCVTILFYLVLFFGVGFFGIPYWFHYVQRMNQRLEVVEKQLGIIPPRDTYWDWKESSK